MRQDSFIDRALKNLRKLIKMRPKRDEDERNVDDDKKQSGINNRQEQKKHFRLY